MTRYFFSIIIILGLFSPSIIAQEVWSLEKCVNQALKENTNIEQLKLSQKFTDLDLDQALHARYPNLNAGSSLNWNFGRTIDPVTNTFSTKTFFANNLSLSTGVTIYNGGRIKNTIKQSEINQKAATLDIQQMERDIALLVANAYLNILFAKENKRIAENQIALSKEQLGQLDKLIRAGTRPANERLTLEAQVATNEQNLITTENAIASGLLNLKQLLRLDINEEIEVTKPASDIAINSDPDILNFAEVYNAALKNQPNIIAASLDVESAEMGVKIAESALLPNLSAGGSLGSNYSNQGVRIVGTEDVYQNFEILTGTTQSTIGILQRQAILENNPYFSQLGDNFSYGAGINLSVPIYNNHVGKNNVERAKLNIENVRLTNQQLKDNLKTNVQQALVDARTAKKQLAAAEKSLEAQKASFNNAQKRYDLGAINTYDYIDAKNQLDIAELNLVISKYDYIFKSKVIDFYMGYPLKLN